MKIFLVEWYNEDDYEPMDRCYAIVQSKDKKLAIKKAKETLYKYYKFTEEDLDRYLVKHKVTDMSKREVLCFNIHAL